MSHPHDLPHSTSPQGVRVGGISILGDGTMEHGMLSYTVRTYCHIMLQCIKIYQMNSNDTYVVLCLQYIWVNWNVSVALRTLEIRDIAP